MQHLVTKGHISFRVILRSNDGHIKMSAVTRGTSVRYSANKGSDCVVQAAQNLLQVLFDPEVLRQDEEGLTKEVQTKLSLGALGSQGLPQGKYEGFGNSPVEKETFKGKVMDYFEKLLTPTDDMSNDVKYILYSPPGQYRPPVFEEDNESLNQVVKESTEEEVKAHVPGKAGGGWETDDEEEHKMTQSKEVQQVLDSSVLTSSSESIERLDIMTTKENTAEAKFVEGFCDMNKFPLALSELDKAVKQIYRLDGIKVLQSLNHFLISHAQSFAKRHEISEEGSDAVSANETESKYLMLALLLLEWCLQAGKVAPEISSAIMKPSLGIVQELTGPLKEVQMKNRKLKLILERK